jgi:hypothetical protein
LSGASDAGIADGTMPAMWVRDETYRRNNRLAEGESGLIDGLAVFDKEKK